MTHTAAAVDAALNAITFTADGLVPVIAQQHDSGEVLMMAWMNADAVRETLTTGRVCYWSRSRGKLWRKGETSGQQQRLVEFLIDCDGDTVLARVDQDGVACHTGRRTCFFQAVYNDGLQVTQPIKIPPEQLYGSPKK
ncbi:phosphoribosyl-AMP cyclohydrolase [Govanella unica]|uniref:Phosphoribosyl-AMP cyclohydrolase n=1 Tax=Govanella unica TaxID=2975056 RepID=A0A9X3TYX5_9PROT|nr:phosphoribosyl-AMP cyclohydrolase [Govania unica]MDA5194294.1 phosphoribosyl-AMP cyclohydrolase [Govania unica]